MYVAEFDLEYWNMPWATSKQEFRIAGSARVRVKQVSLLEAEVERRVRFTMKSRRPFVVVVTTKATGQDSHLDGEACIFVATDASIGIPPVHACVEGDRPIRMQATYD